MSDETLSAGPKPTIVRLAIIGVTTLMAILLYLDRFAVGIAATFISEDLRMSQDQMSWFMSAFFWSYALAQVPAGWLSDRFGARRMLSLYILAWSVFTGWLGFAHQVWQVIVLRLLCGVSQAGAYPTAGGLIRVWFPLTRRGVPNSIVALGGRAGGVLAPILTAVLIIHFSHDADPMRFSHSDIVNDHNFVRAFQAKADSPRAAIVERLKSRFSDTVQASLEQDVIAQVAAKNPQSVAAFNSNVGWFEELIAQTSSQLKTTDLYDGLDLTHLKLVPEARELVQKRSDGVTLSEDEILRLNRLITEAAFPNSVKQFRGAGWRPAMVVYGVIGVLVAFAFFVVVRDLPRLHPWSNAAERAFIESEPDIGSTKGDEPPFPLVAILTDSGLWANSLMQVFTNVGWLFVMTSLPRYLDQVHGVPLTWQAIMTAIPTGAGVLGMYLGGWWTDIATRQFGKKWGRRLPILATRFSAGLGYAICLALSLCVAPGPAWLPWCYVAALCLMVFSVDMGNPAVWGYAQDAGGRFTGSVLGWANMWGNLGAAVAPRIYYAVLGEDPRTVDWTILFGVCGLAFVLSGLCSFLMDSTKPLAQTATT
jgi:ACS family glucarate transporter-like MFS transporter